MGHRHRVQRTLQLLQPEIEEFVHCREVRAEIVALPDIALQQPGMIGPPVEDLRGDQSVALKLPTEVLRISTPLQNRTLFQHHNALQSFHRECFETRASITSLKFK